MSSPSRVALSLAALAAALPAAAAPPAAARAPGVHYEQVTVLYADGQPAGPGVTSRVWHFERNVRLEGGGPAGGPALVLRLDEGVGWRLDPVERVAERLDLDELRGQARSDSALAGELMGAGEPGTVRTAPLPGKTVSGYRCRGWRLRAGSAVVDVYTTTEVPLRMESFSELAEWTGAAEALAGLWDEMRKLPGFPLETRARVEVLGEVQETVSTVTRLEVGPVPAALFEVPAAWRVR